MSKNSRHQNDINKPVVGVLLTNLGTPDEATPAALRRYLREFLSDPRIVEMPRWLWLPILQVILAIRPKRSAHAYQKVWTEQGSPLLTISKQQSKVLQERMQQLYEGKVIVALGMRYGNPSLSAGLESLQKAGAQRVLVLPLYPQYSATTTASTLDKIGDVLKKWRCVPALRMVTDYHDDEAYISALSNSIQEHWRDHGQAECLLFSFHGTPEAMRIAGDPYFDQCHRTVKKLVERLQLPDKSWCLTFQSRFGRQQWLQPYTDKTLRELAQSGIHNIDVICPGFSADCLETLEETVMQNRDIYFAAGGKGYHYIGALNDRSDHVDMLAKLVAENIAGWLN